MFNNISNLNQLDVSSQLVGNRPDVLENQVEALFNSVPHGKQKDWLPVVDSVISTLSAKNTDGTLNSLIDKVKTVKSKLENCYDDNNIMLQDGEVVDFTVFDANYLGNLVKGLAEESKRVKMHLRASSKEKSKGKRSQEYMANLDRHVELIQKKYRVEISKQALAESVYKAGGKVLLSKMLKNEPFSEQEKLQFKGAVEKHVLMSTHIQEVRNYLDDKYADTEVTEALIQEAVDVLSETDPRLREKFKFGMLEPHLYRDLADSVERILGKK